MISGILGSLFVLCLFYREFQVRQHVEIQSISCKGHRCCSNKELKLNMNSSTYSTAKTYTIEASSHWISYMILVISFGTAVMNGLQCVKYLCRVYIGTIFIMFLTMNKVGVIAFQWNRYYLCFIKDQKHYQTGPASIIMRIAFLIAAILTITSLIGTVILVMYPLIGTDFVFEDTACLVTVSSEGPNNLIIYFFLLTDWPILLLFIITIANLSHRIKRISDNEKLGNAVRQANKKLMQILSRILICSLIMESTFILVIIVEGIDTNELSFAATIVPIDAYVNGYFTILMLDHRYNDYRRLIDKMRACLVCFGRNHDRDKYDTGVCTTSPTVAGIDQNGQKRNSDITVDIDVEVPDGAIRKASTFGVEKSYFNSQTSKDEHEL